MNTSVNVGEKFGRLTVLRLFKKGRFTYCECSCECGNIATPRKDALYTGTQKSCGCYQADQARERFTTHGESRHRTVEYDCWAHMIRRCYTPTTKQFSEYGGRGITVCDRWRYSYENFLADMGRRPSAKHSLDRIDNDGNYEPENCRWTTQDVQCNNTRRNHFLIFNGKRQTLRQWEQELGFSRNTIQGRVRNGWPLEQAMTLPNKAHCPRTLTCKYCQVEFLSQSGIPGGCPDCQKQRKIAATRRFNDRRRMARQAEKRNEQIHTA